MDQNFFLKRYEQLGSKETFFALKQSLRVNTLKITQKELVTRLNRKGVVLEKIPFATNGYWISKTHFSLGASVEYLLGHYYLQEAAAQIPVEVLNPKPEDTVLDACASPGGKTTQLAQLMENKGLIVSFEKNNLRIPALKSHLERIGVSNVIAYNTDVVKVRTFGIAFDKILLDAPCSGNFIADPDWLQKKNIEDVEKCTGIQKILLDACTKVLKTNGILVYSTCSLEPEENEMIIDWALENLPLKLEKIDLKIGSLGLTNIFGKKLNKEIEKCKRFWPSKTKTQGFFIAKMVKK